MNSKDDEDKKRPHNVHDADQSGPEEATQNTVGQEAAKPGKTGEATEAGKTGETGKAGKNTETEKAGEAGKAGKNSGSDRQDEEKSRDDTASALKEELKSLKAQNKDYYGQLQRQQAEFDNFRKRTQKEKDDLVKYAAERVLTSMLPIVDNFERALAAAKSNSDMESFSRGVEMIFRQMMTILEKEGLRPIEAVGKPFDPNLHEAVLQEDSEEHAENIVIEELQKGYYLKDKIIRPSMVKVAK